MMDLDRDWQEIDRLLDQEEWPFVRADLEISQSQPNAVALVARSANRVLGFFAAHHFGDVGYLNMMIVDREARVSNIARRLYFDTIRRMKAHGIRAWVAHSTNDSYRVFKFMRFRAGQSFTMLARDPITDNGGTRIGYDEKPSQDELKAIIRLDEQVFGIKRFSWIEAIANQPSSQFFGLHSDGKLIASLCLRERKHSALCIDTTNALDFADLRALINQALDQFSHRRIECIAIADSSLHHHLLNNGFFIPDFFESIGPLVEWRKGDVGTIGTSPLVQSLSWF